MKKLIMALSAFFMNSCLIYGSHNFDDLERSDRSVYCVQGSFVGYNKQFQHLLAQENSTVVGEDNMHDIERFDFRYINGMSLKEREAFRKETFDKMVFGENSIFFRQNSDSIARLEDKRTVESSSVHRENYQFESEMQPVLFRQESCKKLEEVYNNFESNVSRQQNCKKLEEVYNNLESNVSRQQNCQKLSLVYESIESEKPTVKNTPTHHVESENVSQEESAKNCKSFLHSLFGLKRNKVYVDPDNK